MARVLLCALITAAWTFSGCANLASVADRERSRSAGQVSVPSDSSARIAALQTRAHAAEQRGDQAAAAEEYRRILEIDSGDSDAHHHLAVIADQNRQFELASEHYQAALERAPQDLDIHTSLAWSYLLQNRDRDAEQELQAVLRQNPKHEIALCNLGWLCAKRGDDEQALALFRRGGTEAEAQQALADARIRRANSQFTPPTVQETASDLTAPSPWRGRRPDAGMAQGSNSTSQAVATLRPAPQRTPRAVIAEIVPDREPADELEEPSKQESVAADRDPSQGAEILLASAVQAAEPPTDDELQRVEKEMRPKTSHAPKSGSIIQASRVAPTRRPAAVEASPAASDAFGLNTDELAVVGRAVILGNARNGSRQESEKKEEPSEEPTAAEIVTVDADFIEAAKIGLNAALPPAFQVVESRLHEAPRRLKLTQR